MYQYKMNKHLAINLTNGDSDHLEGEDLQLYNSIGFDFIVTDWSNESQDINGVCEFSGLSACCVTIETKEQVK